MEPEAERSERPGENESGEKMVRLEARVRERYQLISVASVQPSVETLQACSPQLFSGPQSMEIDSKSTE